jgi:DNA-binding CsgD family transcriptional regulator
MAPHEKSDHDLVGVIYDGVPDSASWQHALVRLSDATRSMGAQQILHSGCALGGGRRKNDGALGISHTENRTDGVRRSAPVVAPVVPHYERAAQIVWPLGALAALDAAKTAALDRLDHGVLLIDAGARVLFANRAAEAIIALRDGLTVVREGLRAALPADTARLQTLIAETLRGAAGGTLRVTRPSLAEPFLLLVTPARGNWHRSVDPMPAVVIFFTALDQAVAPDLRLLAPALDLTATEAKIAVSIAAGGGVPATARALRLSPNTVHTHLRHIFRKFGVKDQPALVRVLMRAVAMLAASGRMVAAAPP